MLQRRGIHRCCFFWCLGDFYKSILSTGELGRLLHHLGNKNRASEKQHEHRVDEKRDREISRFTKLVEKPLIDRGKLVSHGCKLLIFPPGGKSIEASASPQFTA